MGDAFCDDHSRPRIGIFTLVPQGSTGRRAQYPNTYQHNCYFGESLLACFQLVDSFCQEKAQYRQMATSPVKMATTPSKAYGTPITPAEVGTPMSAETPLPTSPPERNVYIDSSSSVSSPASSRSKKEAKLSSPVSHRSTSPFIDQENDLALSSNSDNPTYVASPQQHTPTIGQSSALSSSPNSSALASSPHLESSTHD